MINCTSALAPYIQALGLQIEVAPSLLWLNGSIVLTPPSVVFLTAYSTSYVYLNSSLGAPAISHSGYPQGQIPIATVVTGFTQVESLIDDRPDYSNVGGGGSTTLFSDAEIPSGTINGSNVTFTLQNAPDPALSLFFCRNGLVQLAGVDYSLSSNIITFTQAPLTGDSLLGWYRY
jgi:hypothetical protein